MNIELKSTGVLLDEYFTTKLKIKYIGDKPEFEHRLNLLFESITDRLSTKISDLDFLVLKVNLERVLEECWIAQDNVMFIAPLLDNKNLYFTNENYKDCAIAAVKAQKLNAERNVIIRKISCQDNSLVKKIRK